MSANLSFNKIPLPKFTKENAFIFQNDSTKLFWFLGCQPLYKLNWISSTHEKKNKTGKLLIATFSSLLGVVVKAASRICAQKLYNITHPGYSYIILSPVYFAGAVFLRVLQADLGSLQAIALLGIIHGAAEVIERSTMVFIDHICHMLWKRRSAPWGSFRTPRRERLMADIAIMSMLYESAAIVSVNGFLYLYQFIYVREETFSNLFQSFSIHTAVSLTIEWVFNSVSLAIDTRYQNVAVIAVWRRTMEAPHFSGYCKCSTYGSVNKGLSFKYFT